MRAAVALLLASSLAFAEPPADAPVLDLAERSVHLEAGQPAPFPGRLLSDAEHVASEKLCADDHATVKAAQSKVLLSPIAVVAIIAGAVAVGAAVSAGVAVAVRR